MTPKNNGIESNLIVRSHKNNRGFGFGSGYNHLLLSSRKNKYPGYPQGPLVPKPMDISVAIPNSIDYNVCHNSDV
jgi:hypothetical protein